METRIMKCCKLVGLRLTRRIGRKSQSCEIEERNSCTQRILNVRFGYRNVENQGTFDEIATGLAGRRASILQALNIKSEFFIRNSIFQSSKRLHTTLTICFFFLHAPPSPPYHGRRTLP